VRRRRKEAVRTAESSKVWTRTQLLAPRAGTISLYSTQIDQKHKSHFNRQYLQMARGSRTKIDPPLERHLIRPPE
jgi:hypothetical protein